MGWLHSLFGKSDVRARADPRAELKRLADKVAALPEPSDMLRKVQLSLLKAQATLVCRLMETSGTQEEKLKVLATCEETLAAGGGIPGRNDPAVKLIAEMISIARKTVSSAGGPAPASSSAASLGALIQAKKTEDARVAVMACVDELQRKNPAALLELVDIKLGDNFAAFVALWTILDKARHLDAATAPNQVRQLMDAFKAGGDFLASGAATLNSNQGNGTLRRQDAGILTGCALLLKALDDQSSAVGTGIRFVQVPIDQWVSFCEYLWEQFYVDSDELRSVLAKHRIAPPAPFASQQG